MLTPVRQSLPKTGPGVALGSSNHSPAHPQHTMGTIYTHSTDEETKVGLRNSSTPHPQHHMPYSNISFCRSRQPPAGKAGTLPALKTPRQIKLRAGNQTVGGLANTALDLGQARKQQFDGGLTSPTGEGRL